MNELTKPTPEFGANVLKAAIEREQKRNQEAVLDFIAQIVREQQLAFQWAEINKSWAAFSQRKLDAVEQGKFSIPNTTLKFDESELNLSWDQYHNGVGR